MVSSARVQPVTSTASTSAVAVKLLAPSVSTAPAGRPEMVTATSEELPSPGTADTCSGMAVSSSPVASTTVSSGAAATGSGVPPPWSGVSPGCGSSIGVSSTGGSSTGVSGGVSPDASAASSGAWPAWAMSRNGVVEPPEPVSPAAGGGTAPSAAGGSTSATVRPVMLRPPPARASAMASPGWPASDNRSTSAASRSKDCRTLPTGPAASDAGWRSMGAAGSAWAPVGPAGSMWSACSLPLPMCRLGMVTLLASSTSTEEDRRAASSSSPRGVPPSSRAGSRLGSVPPPPLFGAVSSPS